MGGHAAGEVASGIAIETITRLFDTSDYDLFPSPPFQWPASLTPNARLLIGAIALANYRVLEEGRSMPGQSGMGTTVVTAHFDEGVVTICHVGDSRAYLLRDGNISRLTVDHSWVSEVMEKESITEEEAEARVNRNVITRALGTKPELRIDVSLLRYRTGDLFILCSDGLSGMVGDGTILQLAKQHFDKPYDLVKALIDSANDAGGADNVTVCAARILEQPEIENYTELRRETIECTSEPEQAALAQIAKSSFGTLKPDPATEDTQPQVPTPRKDGEKKKGRINQWC